jgi:hypothetical protein
VELPEVPPPPARASVGRRWRFRRNLVIYVAHRQGLSQRLLADVFDLPRSRIGAIIQEFRQYESSRPDRAGASQHVDSPRTTAHTTMGHHGEESDRRDDGGLA